MEVVITALSGLLLLGGAFFNVAAAIGVIRLPDVFSRLHAAGMKDTMGSALTLVGLALLGGFSLVTFKLILIWGLLWLTCSVATHSVARAAILGGARPLLAEGERAFDRSAAELRRSEAEAEGSDGANGSRAASEPDAGSNARDGETTP